MILENGEKVGGIVYTEESGESGETGRAIHISGIEILPEYRGKGKGTEIVRQLQKTYFAIQANVQEERARNWWKKMGALPFTGVVYPDDYTKVHTIIFILGRDSWLLFLLPKGVS